MRNVFLGLVALTLATLAIFALWPQIDLDAASAFYGDSGFIGHDPFERAIRAFFNITPFLVLAAFVIAYAIRRAGVAIAYAPTGRQLVFLIATMAIGPSAARQSTWPGRVREPGGRGAFSLAAPARKVRSSSGTPIPVVSTSS